MKKRYLTLVILFFTFLYWPKQTFAADCIVAVNSYGLTYQDVTGSTVNITIPGSQLRHDKPWPIITNTGIQSNTLKGQANVTVKACDYVDFKFTLRYWDGSSWVKETETTVNQGIPVTWMSASKSITLNPSAPHAYEIKMFIFGKDTRSGQTVSYWYETRYFYFYYGQVTQNEATLNRVLNLKVTEPPYADIIRFNSYGSILPPKFYVLYDTNPAVRNNRSPDSKEILIPDNNTSLTSFNGSPDWNWSVNVVNFPVPSNLIQGKTYYWRFRQQADPSSSNNSGGGSINSGGSIGYIPGPASGFTYNVETPTKSSRDIRAFVTSAKYDGNLGGLSGADAKCQTRATAANLGGTWKAWLSDAFTGAEDRITHTSGKYKLINGTTIANGWGDLTDGSLASAINLTETNTSPGSGDDSRVWTNTLKAGEIKDTNVNWECKGWSVNANNIGGLLGYSTANDSSWTSPNTNAWCNNSLRLYCFEKPSDATINQSTVSNKVFITSTNYNGNLGGTEGADAKCQTRATAAGLGGTWKAWISSNTSSPDDKFVHSTSPYKLVDNTTLIAYDWNDLTNGTIRHLIDKDEFGNTWPAIFDSTTPNWGAWTNTSGSGTSASTSASCQNWTSDDATNQFGKYGAQVITNGYWTDLTSSGDRCNKFLKLYCFQQRADTAATFSDYKRIFATSTTYDGNLGGLTGADAKCQTRATAGNLGGTWKAWMSDSNISASSRITHSSVPYTLIDGSTLVAYTWDDLTDGGIQHGINKDELGNVVNGTENVWTGTTNSGLSSSNFNCSNWLTNVSIFNTPTNSYDHSGLGGDGSSLSTNQWSQTAATTCGSNLRLYCIEESTQHNNTPSPAIEPTLSTGDGNTDNPAGANGSNPSSNSSTSSCAIQNDASSRATGLVSAPSLSGKFPNTSGICVIDTESAFAPFKIPQFDDLKSLYFDQK